VTPEAVQTLYALDAETRARLETHARLLAEWQEKMNLVSPATLPQVWERHIADSLQLLALLPKSASSLADIGSGAGFPGLALAAVLAARPGFKVTLIESIAKKCAFLTAASEAMGLSAMLRVHHGRAEDLAGRRFDVVTARAVAPLATLLTYWQRLKTKGGVGLFLKGKSALDELTEARRFWKVSAELSPSRTDPEAKIVIVLHAERRPKGIS
jgi:16S rRNA (guanine527-N7)-methyltransferase